MKVLNLVDSEKSDIKWKPSRFPDGQQQITIQLPLWNNNEASSSVQIKSRLNNWLDLELIICAVASLRQLEVKEIHLYVPYIIGARSDRKFEEGGNNYLKDVICPAINLLNLDSVTCVDPHSNCLEMGIKNFKKIDNYQLVQFALNDMGISKRGNQVFISPDAGASHKIYKLAEKIGYKGDIVTCSKERDENGKLTKTNVPINFNYGKDYIIIDDICDGGATFINIAKELKDKLMKMDYQMFIQHPPKIYLIVTHGIFSKGFSELKNYFDGIYCTNSYSNITPSLLKHSMIDLGYVDNNIKQLNIF